MSATKTIMIRLYADRDDDLLAWLDTMSDEHGAKSLAVKATLRRGLEQPQDIVQADAPIDVETLLEALLPSMRRLVENAIRSELAQVQFVEGSRGDLHLQDQDNIGDQLDALGVELMGDE
ncbi:MAG: hypothetical protein U9Q82_05825 [Chloroflexota bacterium]|nr:hypothetical protein [Chloroflexota bacterium]